MTALIFDCDGVLADTERYGHLPAFNATFDEFGLPAHWDENEYAERLKIGGGKERMASLFKDPGFVEAARIPDDADARAALLATWHKSKTAHFRSLVADGQAARAARDRAGSSPRPWTPAGPSRSRPPRPRNRCTPFSSTQSDPKQPAG